MKEFKSWIFQRSRVKRSSVGLKGSPAGWLIPTLPMEIGSFLSFVNFQKKKNCFGAGNDLSSKVRFKQMILFFLVFFARAAFCFRDIHFRSLQFHNLLISKLRMFALYIYYSSWGFFWVAVVKSLIPLTK